MKTVIALIIIMILMLFIIVGCGIFKKFTPYVEINSTQNQTNITKTPIPNLIIMQTPTPTPTPEIPVFNNSNITPIVVAPIENKTTPNITYITYSGGSGRHRSFSLSPPSTPTPAQIPEFTSVGAMLAVAGSGVGMYLIRRRKNEKT